jgi:hypothetical protein
MVESPTSDSRTGHTTHNPGRERCPWGLCAWAIGRPRRTGGVTHDEHHERNGPDTRRAVRDRCGAPRTLWQPAVWVGFEAELGEYEGCGRTVDLTMGRPVEPTMHTMILRRGTPPDGWNLSGPR